MLRPLLSSAANPFHAPSAAFRRCQPSCAPLRLPFLRQRPTLPILSLSFAMTLSLRPVPSHLPPPVLHARHMLSSRASLLCPPPHPALPRRGGKSLSAASRPRPISPVPCHHTTSAAFHRCQPSSFAICCFPPMPSLYRQCQSCPFSFAMTLSLRPVPSHLPPPVLHARHLLPSRASLLCPPPHPALPRRGGKSLASASRPRPISPVPCHHTTSAAFHRCQPSSLAICCFPPMPSLCRQCPSCPFLSR